MIRRHLARSLAGAALAAALAAFAGACSLGNVRVDECTGDGECEAAFGFGSRCSDGLCTSGVTCSENAECRPAFGYGVVCGAGRCEADVAAAPAGCKLTSPPVEGAELGRPMRGVLLGALFKDDGAKELARLGAVRAAVEEINADTRKERVGLVECTFKTDDEIPILADYLGRRLGVPLILGPASSSASTVAVKQLHNPDAGRAAELVAFISPSASSTGFSGPDDRLVDGKPGLFWRTCTTDDRQAAAMVDHLKTLTDVGKIAIVYGDEPYGKSYKDALLAELGSELTAVSAIEFPYIPGDDAAIQGAVDSAAGSAPDLVVVIAANALGSRAVLNAIAVSAPLKTKPILLTDGSKDKTNLLVSAEEPIKELLRSTVRGVGPGVANANLLPPGKVRDDAAQFAYVAHAWDAAVLGVIASVTSFEAAGRKAFDGVAVAEVLGRVTDGKGTLVPLRSGSVDSAVGALQTGATIDLDGASGPILFDGEGNVVVSAFELWRPNAALTGFVAENIATD